MLRGAGTRGMLWFRLGFRRPLAVALFLSQLVVSAAIHHHAGSAAEDWLFEDATAAHEVHDIACANPTAVHWHRDRIVEVEPCLACLRQHLAGVQVHAPMRAFVATLALVQETPASAPSRGFRHTLPPRGPPLSA